MHMNVYRMKADYSNICCSASPKAYATTESVRLAFCETLGSCCGTACLLQLRYANVVVASLTVSARVDASVSSYHAVAVNAC